MSKQSDTATWASESNANFCAMARALSERLRTGEWEIGRNFVEFRRRLDMHLKHLDVLEVRYRPQRFAQ